MPAQSFSDVVVVAICRDDSFWFWFSSVSENL